MAGIQEGDPQLTAPQQLRALHEQQAALAPSIREYVRSQVDLWRLLPNWVLEADGHSGYGYNEPYYDKTYWLWPHTSHVNIDLRTGELRGSDDGILGVAEEENAFDAQNYIDRYKKGAGEDYFGGYNPRKTAQWRADIRAEDPFLTETLDPSLTLEGQADRLKGVISEIEEAALAPDSELTPEQVKNAIGHVLRASNFDDQNDGTEPIEIDTPFFNDLRMSGIYVAPIFPPPLIGIRAAQEIMQCVSFYIETRSPQFAPLFAKLSERVWHTAVNATAKVRHERGMVHHSDPEWIYQTLGEEYIKRADGNQYMFALPPTEPLKPDAEIGTRGIITAQKVADWFLDTPAEE